MKTFEDEKRELFDWLEAELKKNEAEAPSSMGLDSARVWFDKKSYAIYNRQLVALKVKYGLISDGEYELERRKLIEWSWSEKVRIITEIPYSHDRDSEYWVAFDKLEAEHCRRDQALKEKYSFEKIARPATT